MTVLFFPEICHFLTYCFDKLIILFDICVFVTCNTNDFLYICISLLCQIIQIPTVHSHPHKLKHAIFSSLVQVWNNLTRLLHISNLHYYCWMMYHFPILVSLIRYRFVVDHKQFEREVSVDTISNNCKLPYTHVHKYLST